MIAGWLHQSISHHSCNGDKSSKRTHVGSKYNILVNKYSKLVYKSTPSLSNMQPVGCVQPWTASNVAQDCKLLTWCDFHTLTILYISYAAQDNSPSLNASQKVGHPWVTLLTFYFKVRAWQLGGLKGQIQVLFYPHQLFSQLKIISSCFNCCKHTLFVRYATYDWGNNTQPLKLEANPLLKQTKLVIITSDGSSFRTATESIKCLYLSL